MNWNLCETGLSTCGPIVILALAKSLNKTVRLAFIVAFPVFFGFFCLYDQISEAGMLKLCEIGWF